MSCAKKRGRFPLPKGKRRLASIAFRPTPAMRTALIKAAHETGTSLSGEIMRRLALSFLARPAYEYKMLPIEITINHDPLPYWENRGHKSR